MWHNVGMNNFDDLRVFFSRFFIRQKPKERKMKRVFQWRRYFDWNNLTTEEKLSAKRLLLVPVFAYLIIEIFNHNLALIILLLIGYVLYKKYEKEGIVKK